MPNDETATYPKITQITPDSPNVTQITPDQTPAQPFPFSGSINNPVLSPTQGAETDDQGGKQGC